MQEPESLVIKKKRSDTRRKEHMNEKKHKVTKKGRVIKKLQSHEEGLGSGGLKRKATIIVSKKIIRQATERGQTLKEYIKSNKLKLVDPDDHDIQKLQKSSIKRMKSLRSQTQNDKFRPRSQEETKSYNQESFDSYRK